VRSDAGPTAIRKAGLASVSLSQRPRGGGSMSAIGTCASGKAIRSFWIHCLPAMSERPRIALPMAAKKTPQPTAVGTQAAAMARPPPGSCWSALSGMRAKNQVTTGLLAPGEGPVWGKNQLGNANSLTAWRSCSRSSGLAPLTAGESGSFSICRTSVMAGLSVEWRQGPTTVAGHICIRPRVGRQQATSSMRVMVASSPRWRTSLGAMTLSGPLMKTTSSTRISTSPTGRPPPMRGVLASNRSLNGAAAQRAITQKSPINTARSETRRV
jgi:hypothetical protein